MTIDEAIDILNRMVKYGSFQHTTFKVEALQLGIEALKRIQAYRKYDIGSPIHLPGETSG